MPDFKTIIESKTLIGVGLHRLLVPSSFVAKVSTVTLETSQEAVTIAEFRLGAGAWIVQAKATVKATGGSINPDQPLIESAVSAYLYLEASTQVPFGQKGTLASDEARIITNYRGATMMVIVGIDAPTPASVVLIARNLASGLVKEKAEFSNIVISAMKQDELITVAL